MQILTLLRESESMQANNKIFYFYHTYFDLSYIALVGKTIIILLQKEAINFRYFNIEQR